MAAGLERSGSDFSAGPGTLPPFAATNIVHAGCNAKFIWRISPAQPVSGKSIPAGALLERALRRRARRASSPPPSARETPQPPRDNGRNRQPDGCDDVILPVHRSEYQCDPIYDPRHEPGQRRVVNHRRRSPFPPGFGADGGHRGDAGHVEQDEDEERQRRGNRSDSLDCDLLSENSLAELDNISNISVCQTTTTENQKVEIPDHEMVILDPDSEIEKNKIVSFSHKT